MNKWFYNTFVPSIFERCGAGNSMWLSQKQTAICVDNMEKHNVMFDPDGYGIRHNRSYYTCEWNGRNVIMDYSKKNGCGKIQFYFNEEEQQESARRNEAEKESVKQRTVNRIKSKPERLAKKIADLTAKIASWEEEYMLDIEDGVDESVLAIDIKNITDLKLELALYQN